MALNARYLRLVAPDGGMVDIYRKLGFALVSPKKLSPYREREIANELA